MRSILLGLAAVALFLGSLVMAPLTSEVTMSPCPAGEAVDSERSGFGCVTGCPPGMLLDAQTETCVAAPFDPPAL
jgi:hypothetical protein